jgi:hypothetical protein
VRNIFFPDLTASNAICCSLFSGIDDSMVYYGYLTVRCAGSSF